MIDPKHVRILARNADQLVIGPLGCYRQGERVIVGREPHVVVAVDDDGAGIVRPAAVLRAEYDLELMKDGQENLSPEQFMSRFTRRRTSYPWNNATPDAQAGMRAQWERNRREYLGA